jgi:hypothetical protein
VFTVRPENTGFQPACYEPEGTRHQQYQPEHQRTILEARAYGFRKRVGQAPVESPRLQLAPCGPISGERCPPRWPWFLLE